MTFRVRPFEFERARLKILIPSAPRMHPFYISTMLANFSPSQEALIDEWKSNWRHEIVVFIPR
jgi:hypothetical protein